MPPLLTPPFLRTPADPQRPPSAPHFAAVEGEGGYATKNAGMARNADKSRESGVGVTPAWTRPRSFEGKCHPRFSDEEWRGVKRPH
jgi:hypothetical protein